jgi:hypothetical protein
MTNVQLNLDQMERPLPDLATSEWGTFYEQADNSASDYWRKRYYDDDQGFSILVRWSPTAAITLGHEYTLYAVRRTEPYGFGRRETMEQMFARVEESVGRDGSWIAAWLIPLTQLAQLADREPKVRA